MKTKGDLCIYTRYIVHNIMIIQDLVRHYGWKNVTTSFLMKIYLQKAYDTVDWGFLDRNVDLFEFPHKIHSFLL